MLLFCRLSFSPAAKEKSVELVSSQQLNRLRPTGLCNFDLLRPTSFSFCHRFHPTGPSSHHSPVNDVSVDTEMRLGISTRNLSLMVCFVHWPIFIKSRAFRSCT